MHYLVITTRMDCLRQFFEEDGHAPPLFVDAWSLLRPPALRKDIGADDDRGTGKGSSCQALP